MIKTSFNPEVVGSMSKETFKETFGYLAGVNLEAEFEKLKKDGIIKTSKGTDTKEINSRSKNA